MISPRLMTSSITINYRGPGTVNAYNQVVPGPPIVVVTKGYYRPRRSNTTVTGGETIMSDASVIVRGDVSLDDIESIVVDGVRFSVDGEPMKHWNPARAVFEYARIDLRRGSN